jgi:hypothetical protein
MNTKQLRSKVSFSPSGHGHYKVSIEFRGKEYSSTTDNMPAIDAADRDDDRRMIGDYYETPKQALQSLYDEVKRKNDLR